MKLREYIKKLKEIEREHGDIDLVYSIDDEGNDFRMINYEHSPGFYLDGEYTQGTSDTNCVCVN